MEITAMTEQLPHARASDIPGWPCPPRVRDIVASQNSWGWIEVIPADGKAAAVAQDELGYLWVNGTTVPRFKIPGEYDTPTAAGAVVFWTANGVGLWVHPKSPPHLESISRLDMAPDEWLPVRQVAAELPAFIKQNA
jgi:hypothetical protein